MFDWLEGLNEEAAKGQELLESNFIRPIKDNGLIFNSDGVYQLTENTNLRALNSGSMATCKSPSPAELGESLRKQIKLIYSQFLSDDGTQVDYEGIKNSETFATYEQLAQQLQRVNIAKLDETGRLAFFINIYNALIIHGQVRRGIPPSFLARLRFFSNTSYIIGGYAFSLDQIENGLKSAAGDRRFDRSMPFSI